LKDEAQFLFSDTAESIDEEDLSLGLSDEMKEITTKRKKLWNYILYYLGVLSFILCIKNYLARRTSGDIERITNKYALNIEPPRKWGFLFALKHFPKFLSINDLARPGFRKSLSISNLRQLTAQKNPLLSEGVSFPRLLF